ncbi:YitT family protein [Mycoplasma sp. Z355B]|uniref:YitT family protein n=1 Tax=unclassified Mycoplasma TaxID=2683645 RepID=UPI003A853B90
MIKQTNSSENKHKFKYPTSNEKVRRKIWKEMVNKKVTNDYYPVQVQNDPNSLISTEKVICEEEFLKYKMGKYLLNNTKNTKRLTFKEFIQRYWFKIFLLFWAAFVFNFGIHIFLAKSDTIPSGITGIPTILQYLFPFLRSYFALIYFACNLPLFLIFWRKVKRSFLVYTLIFMLFLQVTNFIFTQHEVHVFLFEKINFVHNDFNDYKLIYNPDLSEFRVIENGDKYDTVKWAAAPLNQVFDYLENRKEFTSAIPMDAIKTLTLEQTNQLVWYADGQTWPILLYGCIGAAFIGVGIALSWKAGGSTGGTDIVAYFFSTKYKKSVGGILATVAFFTACTFLVIYGFVRPNVNGEIFGMRELSTFAYLLVTNFVVSILYPKYKKVKLTIISTQPEKVIAYFKLINYWHSYRLVRFKSGYTGKYSYKIETVALLLETKNIIDDLKLVDPNIWISTLSVRSVNGSFNTAFVEQ